MASKNTATIHRLEVKTPPSAPKRARKSRPKQAPIVAQVSAAFSPEAWLATLVGCVLGGFVPVAAYALAHLDEPGAGLWALVAGGLLFSAKTVWQWGKAAFADPWKASGFVLLLEGVMIWSPLAWLAYGALGILVAINAIATGCTLSGQST